MLGLMIHVLLVKPTCSMDRGDGSRTMAAAGLKPGLVESVVVQELRWRCDGASVVCVVCVMPHTVCNDDISVISLARRGGGRRCR